MRVNWLNTVVESVKLPTDHSIRNSVRRELRNYMRFYSLNSHLLWKSVLYVWNDCRHYLRGEPTWHAAERLYAVGGCIHAFQSGLTREKDNICPFCRTPASKSDEENIKRLEKRMDMNDARAIHNLGCHYRSARFGLPQDHAKALELWHCAGELGNAAAYYNIGCAYSSGEGVERDEKKAKRYWESGAMLGHTGARYNLGVYLESNLGDYDRALKHWMIAVKDGNLNALDNIKCFYSKGFATKDDYAKALRDYQAYVDEIKTNQRDEAVAVWDGYKYYDSSV